MGKQIAHIKDCLSKLMRILSFYSEVAKLKRVF